MKTFHLKISLLGAFIAATASLFASINYDSNGATYTANPGGGSISTSFNNAGGQNQIMFVVLTYKGNLPAMTVTYNGAAFTLLRTEAVGSNYEQKIYYRLAPSTGSNTVQVSGSVWNPISVNMFTYSGVKQVAPANAWGTNGTPSGAPWSQALGFTPSVSTSKVIFMNSVDAAGSNNFTGYAANNGSTRYSAGSQDLNSNYTSFGLGDWAPGTSSAVSVTQSWSACTTCSGSKNFISQAVELLPATSIECGTVSIDGALSDTVWAAMPYQAVSTCGGTCPVLGTQSAQFKFAYDTNYLYVAADVNDPFVSKSQANPWDRSGIEVWFDMNNSNGGSMAGTDYQFIANWDGSSISAYQNGGGIGLPAGVTAAGVTKAGGYTIEMRFTWASISAAYPSAGTTLSGINMQADFPVSSGGNRDRWLSWTASNNNPGTWTDLTYGVCPAATPTVTPTFTMTPTVTQTPTPFTASCGSAVVDGAVTDSIWGTLSYKPVALCGGTCPVLGSQSAQYKVAWDTSYLYILADVNDPNVSKTQSNPWDRSGVELWFDFNNSGGGSMAATDYQFIVNWDGSSINAYQNGGGITLPAGITAAGITKAGGYTLEMRFSWASISGSMPSAGSSITGINMQADFPSSVGGNRDRWLSWSASNNDPSSWGDLNYGACPVGTNTASPSATRTSTPMSCGTPVCSGSWTVIGSGSVLSPGYIRMTNDVMWQATAMWSNFKLDLSQTFSASYDLYFGTKDAGGADGIVFVMQNDPRGLAAIGDNGQGISYANAGGANGAISPSVDVEWDTWQNAGGGDPINYNDPANDHTSIHINGNGDESSAPVPAVDASSSSGNIEDGLWHRVRIDWTYNSASSQTMSTYFDGVLRQTWTSNIVGTVFGGQTCVFWGFTSGTGGSSNLQEVKEDSCFSPTPTPTSPGTSTRTPSISPTRTPSATVSPVASITYSPTITRTNSQSPTMTASGTVTLSPTISPTYTTGTGCPAPVLISSTNAMNACYGTSNTQTFSNPGGTNTLLVLMYENGQNVPIASASYGASSFSNYTNNATGFGGRMQIWYIVNPPTGSNTLSVNMGAGNCSWNVTLALYSGVDQSSPFGATAYADVSSGTDPYSHNITTTYTNSVLQQMVAFDSVSSISYGTGQTALNFAGGCCYQVRGSYKAATASGASYNMLNDVDSPHTGASLIQEIKAAACVPTPTSSPSRTVSPSLTPTPVMPIVKSANVSTATLGDTITYTLAWSNDSSGSVNISLWDSISSALTFQGCDNACTTGSGMVMWNLGSKGPGSSGSVKFWAIVTGYP